MPSPRLSRAFRWRTSLIRSLAFIGQRSGFFRALACLLLAVFALACLAQLRANNWNTDMDYFMYHGGRILHGELPWVKEYHDKLPVAHYFFVLPAWRRSIRVWQLISIAVIVMAGIVSFRPLTCMLRRGWGLSRSDASSIALLAVSMMAYSYASLPSGISIFTPFAASLFTMSLFLEAHPCGSDEEHRRLFSWRSLLAALLAVTAISMRPYFLLPVILIAPWRVMRSGQGILSRFGLLLILRWIVSLALLEIVIDFLPYGLTGNGEVVVAALKLLSQPFVPGSPAETFRRQLRDLATTDPIVFIGLSSGAVLIAAMAVIVIKEKGLKSVLRGHWIDAIFLCLLMPGSLAMTIAMKHYYEHYLHHYVPFALVGLALLASLVIRLCHDVKIPRPASLVLASLALLQLLFLAKAQIHGALLSLARPQLDQRLADDVAIQSSAHLDEIRAKGFLHPLSMYVHWKYGQSRHGFPNTFNTQLILTGAWKNLKIPPSLRMPQDLSTYCQKVVEQGPQFLFVYADDALLLGCMKGAAARSYVWRERLQATLNMRPLLLFTRR